MNKQQDLPGTEKTAEQKAQEVKALRGAIAGCLGLPSKSTEIVEILKSASPEDLNSIVNVCKAATPRIRVLGQIATELSLGK